MFFLILAPGCQPSEILPEPDNPETESDILENGATSPEDERATDEEAIKINPDETVITEEEELESRETSETMEEPAWQKPFLLVVYEQQGIIMCSVGYNAPFPLTEGGKDGRPLISPDGNNVLFQRHITSDHPDLNPFELWLVSIDGTEPRPLVTLDQLPGEIGQPLYADEEILLDRLPSQYAWSEKGDVILFNTVLEEGYGYLSYYDLWQADPVSGQVTQLLPDGEGGSFALSPDNTTLLIADTVSVSIADADGDNHRELFQFPLVNTGSEYPYIPQPVWASDSSYGLLAISDPEPFIDEEPTFTIWRISRSGEAEIMTTVTGSNYNDTMSGKLFSPDGQHFAYTTGAFPDGKTHIATIDGTIVSTFDDYAFHVFGWSTDGNLAIFDGDFFVFLGGVEQEMQELEMHEEVYAWNSYIKWVSPGAYVGIDWSYFLEESILWTTEIGSESRIIDRDIRIFDALLVD